MTSLIRDRRGRIQAGGGSLNPRGRPKTGLAAAEMIRELGEGEADLLREVIAMAWDVARGRAVSLDLEYLRERAAARAAGLPDPPRRGEAIQPNMAEIQRAWDFIFSWGYRKPPQELEVGPSDQAATFDYTKLSDLELEALERLQLKAAGVLDVGEPGDAVSSRRTP